MPRFSLLSALIALAAVCSLCALNTIPRLDTLSAFHTIHGLDTVRPGDESGGEGNGANVATVVEYGWPRTYRIRFAISDGTGSDYLAGILWHALGFNIATAMGIALGVTVSTELLLRMSRRHASRNRRSPSTSRLQASRKQ
jgi:hypothetical protein